MGDVRVNRSAAVGLGLVLSVIAMAVGVGMEVGLGWGLLVGGGLAWVVLVFIVDVGEDDIPGGDT